MPLDDEYERDQYGKIVSDERGLPVKKRQRTPEERRAERAGKVRSLEDQAAIEAEYDIAGRDNPEQMNEWNLGVESASRLRKLQQGSTFDMDFDTKQAAKALMGYDPSRYSGGL
jgi:hypothetical protein